MSNFTRAAIFFFIRQLHLKYTCTCKVIGIFFKYVSTVLYPNPVIRLLLIQIYFVMAMFHLNNILDVYHMQIQERLFFNNV